MAIRSAFEHASEILQVYLCDKYLDSLTICVPTELSSNSDAGIVDSDIIVHERFPLASDLDDECL